MTQDEWDTSQDAKAMLRALYEEQPEYFGKQTQQLHRYLIACCWKHKKLIPQTGLRDGLKGAIDWIEKKIDDNELNRLNWYAEADAFLLDYGKDPDATAEIEAQIANTSTLKGMKFDEARECLKKAAYFAEGSMIYPQLNPGPWIESLFESDFVCPDLLREHLNPSFD